MKAYSWDPRVKFLVVAFITCIGVISSNISLLFVNFLAGLAFAKLFDVHLLKIIKRLKKVLYLLIFIIVIQSIFTTRGIPLIKIFGFSIITDAGLKIGIGYLFRVLIILISGAIISTSNTADVLKGFSKLGMPYALAFTASLGVRFLPILMEEIQSTYIAIQLRGINIQKLKLSKRIQMITYLFMPVIYSTIVRSKKLAESVETRGFSIGAKRTSYRDIRFTSGDYMLCIITVLVFAGIIYLFNLKGDYYESFFSNRIY